MSPFFENAPDAIFIHDYCGKIIEVNSTAVSLFGYSKEEIQSMTIMDLNVSSPKLSSLQEKLNLLNTEKTLSIQSHLKRKGRGRMLAETKVSKIQSNNQEFYIAHVRDISEREENETKFRAIFDNSEVAIGVSKEGINTVCNKAYLEMFGYEKQEEIIGKPIIEQVAVNERNRIISNIQKRTKGEPVHNHYETIGLRKDGSEFPFEISIGEYTLKNEKFTIAIIRDITERKKAETALKESQLFNETILNASPDIIYVYDIIKKRNIYSNTGIELILGYTAQEIKEMGSGLIQTLMHPDDYQFYISNTIKIYQTLKDGEFHFHEYRMKHKKGYWNWMSSKESIFTRGENGNPQQIFGIVTDKTNQILAEKKIQETEWQFRQLFENMEQGFALHEMIYDNKNKPIDYRFIMLNTAFEKLTGLKSNEITGKTVKEILPEIEPVWIKNYGKVAKHGKPLQFESFSRELNKHYSVIAYSPRKDFFAVVFTDITEKYLREKEIIKAKERAEESEKKLKESQTIARLGSWELDVETGIFTFTDNFYSTFRTNAKEMGGYQMTINDYTARFVHPDDSHLVEEETKKALLTDDPEFTNYVEHRIIYNDGGVGFIGVRFFIEKDKNGKTVKTYGVNQDITERKKAEIELMKAKEKAEESDRLKTEFLNNMSHEIRTPMNGIMGFSDLLEKPGNSPEKSKYYTRIIKNSSAQLLHIIDDILEISALGTNQVKIENDTFNLNFLLMDLFSIFNLRAKENNISLYIKKGLTDKESVIEADKTKLSKILSNLIENALKFTISGFIEFGYTIQKTNILLYVKDTGVGIDPKNHERIFERFAQEEKKMSKKYGGLGLGLSIAKENVELLGGKITLESEKEKGTTFFISIPYNTPQSQKSLSNGINVKLKNENDLIYTILIAEDEEVNFLYLEELLCDIDGLNIKIIHAKNGREAVEFCKTYKTINLILMDLKMPVLDGFEATKRIRASKPDLPIIAQTAYSTETDKQKAINVGCKDFISKPIDRTVLIKIINSYMISS